MIETCNAALTHSVKDSWKKSYNMLAPHYTDFFFNDIYKPEYGYVNTVAGKCAASLVRVPCDVLYNGAVLKTSILKAPCLNPEYRNKPALLKELTDTVMDACEHTELFTLVNAREINAFKDYDFEPFYMKSAYALTRDEVQRITNFGCAYEPQPLDMLKVYSAFIRHFNGFGIRKLEDFSNLKRSINSRGGKIVAYYDGKNQIQGYATILLESREEAVITECIYLNSTALNKLLNAALQERPRIQVIVSENENLSKIFTGAKETAFTSHYIRINHTDLLSRQLGQKIYRGEDLLRYSRGPLHFSETFE